jgi:hypothetical protein
MSTYKLRVTKAREKTDEKNIKLISSTGTQTNSNIIKQSKMKQLASNAKKLAELEAKIVEDITTTCLSLSSGLYDYAKKFNLPDCNFQTILRVFIEKVMEHESERRELSDSIDEISKEIL